MPKLCVTKDKQRKKNSTKGVVYMMIYVVKYVHEQCDSFLKKNLNEQIYKLCTDRAPLASASNRPSHFRIKTHWTRHSSCTSSQHYSNLDRNHTCNQARAREVDPDWNQTHMCTHEGHLNASTLQRHAATLYAMIEAYPSRSLLLEVSLKGTAENFGCIRSLDIFTVQKKKCRIKLHIWGKLRGIERDGSLK